jgi:MoaA/NifB/PqqE/SkfB family radical SAM enzyme
MIGLKTVEWTGGGDPTLYPYINDIIKFSHNIGLKQGLITNGILLRKIDQSNLNRLYWIRISMNCLDYVEGIEIPKIKGVMGFSYVMNEKTDQKVIKKLKVYAEVYAPKYIRIVPNCQATNEEQEKNNRTLSKMVAEWGEPFFYQEKIFDRPKNCWWCYYKPYVAQDGWVFPCSSVILNENADYKFHENYRWCKMSDLPMMYERHMKPFNPKECNHCVFKRQNDLIEHLLNPDGMEDFI